MVRDESIRSVRIDVPVGSTRVYMFVDAELEKWDPWWRELYEYLLGLPGTLEWRHEPVQDVRVARPPLSEAQRRDLARFLRSAPAAQVNEHRTLRRAVELTEDQEKELAVTYFSAP